MENLTVTKYQLTFTSMKLSFSDLSMIDNMKPDNETYLCGISNWEVDVPQEVSGCQSLGIPNTGTQLGTYFYLTDNGTLRFNAGDFSDNGSIEFPDDLGCDLYAPSSQGVYLQDLCDNSSSSSSGSGTSNGIDESSPWAGTQQLGTSNDDRSRGVTVDSSDNLYVTGKTNGGMDTNTNSGNYDIFLVKYNSSGVKQWTRQLGTSSADSAEGVTVDSSDNIYVMGNTEGGLDNNTCLLYTSDAADE